MHVRPASHSLILSFGEALFDCFEDRRCLGGAPLNFAWNLRQFGFPVAVVSAVGPDRLGVEILQFLDRAGLDRTWITCRPEPTGTVDVRLVDGEPDFTINEHVAWDRIEVSVPLSLRPSLLYFGTVAQRTAHNQTALSRLLDLNPPHRLFDINLRQHYYSAAIVLDGLRHATILKLNQSEWDTIRQITAHDTPAEALERFHLDMIALTRGAEGAELYVPDGVFKAHPPPVTVVDTVGAGDAFSAALAAGVLSRADPATILDVACAAGAAVVRQPGAHVTLPDEVVTAFG
ncbi:MAG: carbohydrate kinase [Candidatus Latescibacteria bacterium]|nr:carbohydrate kinase [Candidatus Latescibacterota bacterium]